MMSGHHCPRSTKKMRQLIEATLWTYDDVVSVVAVGSDQLRVRYDDGAEALFSIATTGPATEIVSTDEVRKSLETLPGGSRIGPNHPFWEQLQQTDMRS